MPNTLVHLGLQSLVSKALHRQTAFCWIALGLLLPDLPWIEQRVLALTGLVDPLTLRAYCMIQASLALCLLLALALSLLARHGGLCFCLLAGNSLLHLLLDASEIKWGNGIHLLAPFSWQMQHWGLVWPESPLIQGLTLLGLGLTLFWLHTARPSPPARLPSRRALLAALLVLTLYLSLPLCLLAGPYRADNHGIATLAHPAQRPGKTIAIDRGHFKAQGRQLTIFSGERFTLVGDLPNHDATCSIQGRFLTPERLLVLALHVHDGRRDLASLSGLVLIAIAWIFAWGNKNRYARQT